MAEIERDAARMVAELEAKHPSPPPPPLEPEPSPVTLVPNSGPTWMSAEDWEDRLAAYRRQGRSESDIREVAAHLERRGPRKPRTPAEQVTRAKSLGHVARAEYLSPEDEARGLALGPSGLPNARLERVRDRLLVATPLGWVNPKSRTAYKAGLYSFTLRGTGYYEQAVRAGRFTPGAPVRLVRESENQHDPNAIAVYAERGRNRAGYVPKGYAKRLAPLLDSGADVVAVSVRGSGAGSDETTPHILVCERRLLDHLNR